MDKNKEITGRCQAATSSGITCVKNPSYIYTGFNGQKICLCGIHARSYRGNPHLVIIENHER